MKILIKLILILSASAFAQPQLYPTTFLNCREPERMCDNYIRATYGDSVTCWTQPSGGALARIRQNDHDLCVYFFCDQPTHRMVVFSLTEDEYGRTPVSAKSYGRMFYPQHFEINEFHATTLKLNAPEFNSTECFLAPVDVAVSSAGRNFDPEYDYVFVLDQGNHRVAQLRYDVSLDSLFWVGSFGSNDLVIPTAIDYNDYGDQDRDNDDIYVTDAAQCSIIRFSAAGVFETSYGGWGPGLADISYPTGIAVSTMNGFYNRIYITDSHNHRVSRYISDTDGPITPELIQFTFPLDIHPPLPLINGVDTDADGFVYVLDTFHNWILILSPDLVYLDKYGERGYEPGQFDYPSDIYIDGNEMQICENYADSSGIQTFNISAGSPKRVAEALPKRFYLAQNYPNPFNSNTTIMFELPEPGDVEISIYDILGRKVTALIDEKASAGSHAKIWSGTNQFGQTVASGIYFYRLESDLHVATKKLLLLK